MNVWSILAVVAAIAVVIFFILKKGKSLILSLCLVGLFIIFAFHAEGMDYISPIKKIVHAIPDIIGNIANVIAKFFEGVSIWKT